MKLTKIALSVLVVAGVAVGAGSWYTGKQVEARYQEMIDSTNQRLQTFNGYEAKAQIKEVKLTRHLFSTDASYIFEVALPEGSYQFKGNDTLYHGPLPLNRLREGNLKPVLMSMDNHITLPAEFATKIVATEPFKGQSTLTYGGKMEGEFAIPAFTIEDNGLKSRAMKIKLADFDPKTYAFKTEIDQIDLADNNGEQMRVEGLKYESKPVATIDYPHLGLGHYDLKANKFSFSSKQSQLAFNIQDLQVKSEGEVKSERLLSNGEFIGDLTLVSQKECKEIKLGKFKSEMKFDLDARSTNELTEKMSKSDNLTNEEVMPLLLKILNKAPKLPKSEFSLENKKGKSALSLVLNLKEGNVEQVNSVQKALDLLSDSSLNVKVDLAFTEQLLTQFALSDGLNPEEATTQAKARMAEFVGMLKQARDYVVVNNTDASVTLKAENGKMTLNGREVSNEEIESVLFMLMMMGVMGSGQ
ncbi:hypothetical protein A4G19_14740 [Pasteurellaceae bacterium Macca]|nr:hypothetical protein [Pasteurellaceae bacterium Macca]